MRLILEMGVLALVGAVAGLVINDASPHPIRTDEKVEAIAANGTCGSSDAPKTMTLSEAVQACGECTVGFVDARSALSFAEGHIPGAVHLQAQGEGDESSIEKLRGFSTVVAYDSAVGCGLAEGVIARLHALGFQDVRKLDGDFTQWERAGGPAQSGACESCGDEDPHSPGEHP